MPKTSPPPKDLCTPTAIAEKFHVPLSAVYQAVNKSELEAWAQVLGGNGQTRPIFTLASARKWAQAYHADRESTTKKKATT